MRPRRLNSDSLFYGHRSRCRKRTPAACYNRIERRNRLLRGIESREATLWNSEQARDKGMGDLILPLDRRSIRTACWACIVALVAVVMLPAPAVAARGGKLTIHLVDAETQQPIAGRMHLKNARGRAVKPAGVSAYWHDHFTIDGSVDLPLRVGGYQFEVECGPEYKVRTGHFKIEDFADDAKTFEMHRFVDLSQEGWWSGDLDVRRRPSDMDALMRGEDLHLAAPVAARSSRAQKAPQAGSVGPLLEIDPSRFVLSGAAHDYAGRDGALLLFHLPPSFTTDNYPTGLSLALAAGDVEGAPTRVRIDVPRPQAWQLPVWLAADVVDSIGILNARTLRDGASTKARTPLPVEGDRPIDRLLYPGPQGHGRWSEQIYYHVLNSGLRVPPSAGSGSGATANPPGYNRVYVHCSDAFSYETWWENLRAGRVFVTNGPLMRASVAGHPPGYVITGYEGETLELEIGLTLSTREKIDYLEVIKNGRTLHEIRLDEWAAAGGRIPKLTFDESGWFLVRAVTNHAQTYRLASTAPYYVEFDRRPRISRRSVQYFLDWLDAAAEQWAEADGDDGQVLSEEIATARLYWQQRLSMATVD